MVRGQTHGGAYEPLHRVWRSMRQRCNNPHHRSYMLYGGRGIFICSEWDDYAVFREWATLNGYAPKLDIDRIDNDKGYSPNNCRFVTRSENLRNTRKNKLLVAWGETKPLVAWSEDARCVVLHKVLESRIRAGWSAEDALSTPSGNWNPQRSTTSKRAPITAWGETKMISQWLDDDRCQAAAELVQKRLRKDWTTEDALSKPSNALVSRSVMRAGGTVT